MYARKLARKGFSITYLGPEKDRSEAVREAIKRTDRVLLDKMSRSPIIERIQRVRDAIISSTELREVVSHDFLLNKLGCSDYTLKHTMKRANQLYPDLKAVKIFGVFPHYYHASMDEKDLNALVEMRKNYIRKTGGRRARVGHNWEAVVTFFIDHYTDAEFMTQKHRSRKMDERRITVYLVKPVAGRTRYAKIDRCWRITPSVFSKPITYCMEAKYGVVMKRHIDDFLSILKYSKEFGYDTERGREIKTGVIPVFAGSTFNPNEKIYLENEGVDLATYASRMNVQFFRASDFNRKLEESGVNSKICTVQKICRVCKDEKEVRDVLSKIFKEPKKVGEILRKVMENNEEIYEFEKLLEEA